MELESVPEILATILHKLRPLLERFNDVRYAMLEGGRASAKSQTVARFLLYIGSQYRLRIVCGREIQQNIAESSYTLLTDLIQKFSLDYEISATKIVCPSTGTTFYFRGFRDQNRFSIQGLENVQILWVDEAQSLTKDTLDVLIPTIRGQRSKLIFTLNRFLPQDAVYEFLVGRPDCLHIHCDYFDNPNCPQAIIREAQECQKRSDADYRHIWLGMPADQSSDAIFTISELEEAKKKDFPLQAGFGKRVAGFDIARYGQDKNACVIFEQRDLLHWKLIHAEEWEKQDLNFTAGKILEIINARGVDFAAVDIDGMGAGPFDALRHGRGLDFISGFSNQAISRERNTEFANNRTVHCFTLKDMVSHGHIGIDNDKLILELLSLKYKFTADQRRILVSKDEMKRQGVMSPNLADAAIYACSLISEVKETQERPYQANRHSTYSNQPWNPFKQSNDDGDLFGIAGIR